MSIDSQNSLQDNLTPNFALKLTSAKEAMVREITTIDRGDSGDELAKKAHEAIKRLGDVSSLSKCLSAMISLAEGKDAGMDERNAEFRVAILNNDDVKDYIVNRCEGITKTDLELICDEFKNYLRTPEAAA